MNKQVKIEISARHIHISKNDLFKLFGEGYELTKYKDLSVDDEFATNEKIDLISKDGKIEGVRILGPVREKTQIELSLTDARILKISPPVRLSGNLENSGSLLMKGPMGEINLESGVIIAKRHFHSSIKTAEELNIKNNDIVSVKIGGVRGLIFDNIEVRVDKNFHDTIHIDTDEGNACSENGVCMFGELITK